MSSGWPPSGYFIPPYRTFALPEAEEEPADPPCKECGEPTDDGEGYDGYCGNCADRAETRGEWGP